MPSAGLLALLDDITSLLDDVATMTKVATKKTAGVIGDDLALNANQVTGFSSAREIPIVLAVAKGSLLNKAVLIPTALAITAFLPFALKPLLMVGGAFLCFEGAEKVLHKIIHTRNLTPDTQEPSSNSAHLHQDPADMERLRVKGAVLTDFILSAEILVIALGAVQQSSLLVQSLALIAIGIGMTVVVYGSVALIVKADDFGVLLQRAQGEAFSARSRRRLGRIIIAGAPKLMQLLSFLGTSAMFLVGGEIFTHAVPALEHSIQSGREQLQSLIPLLPGTVGGGLLSLLTTVAFGFALGLGLVMLRATFQRLRKTSP